MRVPITIPEAEFAEARRFVSGTAWSVVGNQHARLVSPVDPRSYSPRSPVLARNWAIVVDSRSGSLTLTK